MITGLLISIFIQFVKALFIVLPASSGTASAFQESVNFVIDYAYGWDWILPITDALQIIVWSTLIAVSYSVFKGVLFIIGLIRGISFFEGRSRIG